MSFSKPLVRTKMLAIIIGIFGLSVFGFLVLAGGKADAATMPNPGDFTTNHGQPKLMRILVGDSGTITVTDSYVKIYSIIPNPQLTFQNISGCATRTSTMAVYATNSAQTVTGNIGSTTLNSSNCPSSFTWTLSGSALANIGTGQYYVWIIQASSSSAGLTYFNLSSSNADFGYIGKLAPGGLGDDRFAIQNSYNCSSVGSYSPWSDCTSYKAHSSVDYKINFATHCANTTNSTQRLRWYDDDQNNPETNPEDAQPQSMDMRFDIYDETSGSYVVQNYRPSFGNDQEGYYDMVFKPAHKYRWVWKNVVDSNALQFQLPYDSYFYKVTCDNPPVVVLDPSCDTLKFRVSDADNDKYDVRLRWDKADTSSLLQNLNPGNNPGQNVYEFDISNRKDFVAHDVSVRVVSKTGTVVQDKPVVSIGPCAKAWCSADPTLSPANPTPGQPFTLTSTISTDIGPLGKPTLYSAQVATQGTATITYQSAGPGAVAVPNPVTVVGPNSGSNTAGPTSGGGIGPGSSPGGNNETVSWTMVYPSAGNYSGWVAYNGGFSLNCQFGNGNQISVSDKPYLRVWGGDVAVGCSDSDIWKTAGLAGEVRTYSLSDGKGGHPGDGAGTNLSVQARRLIDGFSSAQRASIPIDDYLTFANTGSGGVDPTWGGDFGGEMCPSDFYSSAPSTTTGFYASLPASSVVRSYSSGGMLSTNSRVIQPGQDVTLYVNGDVTLTGTGIRYNTGGWSDLSKIPSFKLIVRGDIKIANTVSELSGLYVAQPRPDGSGGNIITCVDGNGNKYNSSAIVGSCSNTLTIYGAFVAKNVKFLRLSGSIATASSGDAPGTGSAAEKFVYSPEMWLNSKLNTSVGNYDSVTSMPPVF